MEGSNLRFLIQSQASYHWTNPQNWRGGAGISSGPAACRQGKPAGNCQYNNTRRAVCQGLRQLSAGQSHIPDSIPYHPSRESENPEIAALRGSRLRGKDGRKTAGD